ncbi:hypothetical protein H9651_13275 [Microbacterium sp. Sa4CUA7]|uniref:Uncharacterized protein n=1 Tax=Microbacterium pullorum TaxID=2762236 RepID=A0ABR8S561_9MICO|nr:hypothetical protein [Microbacterium pullorum]
MENPSDDHFYVAAELWECRPDEVNGILERFEPRLVRLSLYFPLMSPELTLRAMLRGVPFDLGLQHQRWDFAAAVILRLADVNCELTAELMESNLTAMVEGLSGNFSDPFEGLAAWVAAADSVDPTYIDRVIGALPEGAVSAWSSAIRRPMKYGHARRREIAPLVFRALDLPGTAAQEARELLRKFPSLAKLDPLNGTRAPKESTAPHEGVVSTLSPAQSIAAATPGTNPEAGARTNRPL